MNKVVDVLNSDAYRRYLRAEGVSDPRDDRFAVMDPQDNGETAYARGRIYARLAETASGKPTGRSGIHHDDRVAAAKECIELWPKAWDVKTQAATDPIFDDRFI